MIELRKQQIELFQTALYQSLAGTDTSKFSYIGLVGSAPKLNTAHDVDVLVLPAPNTRPGAALIAMHELLDTVHERLSTDHDMVLSRTALHCMQQEVDYLVRLNHPNIIPTHTLFYPDAKSYHSRTPQGFAESVRQNQQALLGDLEALSKLQPHDQRTLDAIFTIENAHTQGNARTYPAELVVEKGQRTLDYVTKHWLKGFGIKPEAITTPSSAKTILNEALLAIDETMH